MAKYFVREGLLNTFLAWSKKGEKWAKNPLSGKESSGVGEVKKIKKLAIYLPVFNCFEQF